MKCFLCCDKGRIQTRLIAVFCVIFITEGLEMPWAFACVSIKMFYLQC